MTKLATAQRAEFADLTQGESIEDMARRVLAAAPPLVDVGAFSMGGYVARAMARLARFPAAILAGTVSDVEALAEIQCPTLVIGARDDRLRSLEAAQELKDHIPGARLVVLDHSGHMLPMERAPESA